MQVVHAAIDQVSAATGLKFVQDGRTHVVPSDSDHGLPADVPAGVDATYVPVLISWATEDEFPPLAGGVVGVATPYAFDTGSSYFKPRHVYQYVTGEVVLDADYNRNIAAQGWTGEEQAIVMHELGHVVGLDHVHASTELMNKDNAGLLHYGPGDLQGLAEAGNGRCTF
jgi:hypothetical protein